MAKNYKSPGNQFAITAPVGGVVSGQPMLIGSMFCVFLADAAAGEPAAAAFEGVFDIPKGAIAFTQGEKVFFKTANAEKTSAGAFEIGVATEACAVGDSHVSVRLGVQTLAV